MSAKYKRILLKLSGEQLAGKFDGGIDPEVAGWWNGIFTAEQKTQNLHEISYNLYHG